MLCSSQSNRTCNLKLALGLGPRPILKLLARLLPELNFNRCNNYYCLLSLLFYDYYYNIIVIIAVIRVQLMHAFLHYFYLLGEGDVLAMLNECKLP